MVYYGNESQRELEAYNAQQGCNHAAKLAGVELLVRQVDALQVALLRQAKDIKAIQAAVAKLKAKKVKR